MAENSVMPTDDVFRRFFENIKSYQETPEYKARRLKLEEQEAGRRREAERLRDERRLDRMRIPERYRGLSLEAYTVSSAKQRKVVEYLREYGRRDTRGMENLIIRGPLGTGKTRMVCALIQDCRAEARYWKLSDVMRTVKDGFSGGKETELRLIKRLAAVPVLVIDEIGRQGGTAFEGGFMFDLLDDRYGNLLPTILVSNLPVTGDPGITSYLGISAMDRINENSLDIPCEWGSYRGRADKEGAQ